MQGSIQKRTGKRGTTWTVVVDLPRGTDGKRRQRRLSAPTKRELEALLAKTLHEVQSGTYVESTNLTVGEYLPKWLESAAATVKPATVLRYSGLIANHLAPTIGAVPLAKLSPLTLQDLYGRKMADGLSPATVRMLHAVIHRALGQAVRWHMVPRNVAEDVDVPRREAPELVTWT